MSTYWFFAKGGAVFVAAADCGSLEVAVRLARAYNQHPGTNGPVDLIADHLVPAEARRRITVDTSANQEPKRDPAED